MMRCRGCHTLCERAVDRDSQESENMAFGCSGIGRSRMGAAGLLRYLRPQALLSNNSGTTRSIMDAGEKGKGKL